MAKVAQGNLTAWNLTLSIQSKGFNEAKQNFRQERNEMMLNLRDLTSEDLPLIERWLHTDCVRKFWGDPNTTLQLLKVPPVQGKWRAIIETEGHPVGIVLWQHPTREELDLASLFDIPTSVIDIDIMIGEIDALGRGLGSKAILISVFFQLALLIKILVWLVC